MYRVYRFIELNILQSPCIKSVQHFSNFRASLSNFPHKENRDRKVGRVKDTERDREIMGVNKKERKKGKRKEERKKEKKREMLWRGVCGKVFILTWWNLWNHVNSMKVPFGRPSASSSHAVFHAAPQCEDGFNCNGWRGGGREGSKAREGGGRK